MKRVQGFVAGLLTAAVIMAYGVTAFAAGNGWNITVYPIKVDRAIQGLYEANMDGKITDERFMKMTESYEAEQKQLTVQLSEAKEKFRTAEQNKVDLRLPLKTLREFSEVRTLTPELVNTLIRRIEIHNNDKYDGHCHVKVDIYFTGVGMIDVPTEQEIQKLMDELQPKEATRIPA